jgi:hypothetical protein
MTATTPEEAQLSLDRFLAGPGDARERRMPTGAKTTVGVLGDAEPLLGLPAAAFPATIEVARVVAANATVAFRGNRYSVPPGLTDVSVSLRHRLGASTVEIYSPAGGLLAEHRLAPPGAGSIVRSVEHHAALERVVLSAFSTERPCDRKANRPPGPEALAAAAALLGNEGRAVVVDLAVYAELAEVRA